MFQVPHGYQDIYPQASWRFPSVSTTRGSSIPSLSMSSMPEDFSTHGHSSPHSSPGRALVSAAPQYTASSPHSSPGHITLLSLSSPWWSIFRRACVLSQQPLQHWGGPGLSLPRLQPVLQQLLLLPEAATDPGGVLGPGPGRHAVSWSPDNDESISEQSRDLRFSNKTEIWVADILDRGVEALWLFPISWPVVPSLSQ